MLNRSPATALQFGATRHNTRIDTLMAIAHRDITPCISNPWLLVLSRLRGPAASFRRGNNGDPQWLPKGLLGFGLGQLPCADEIEFLIDYNLDIKPVA